MKTRILLEDESITELTAAAVREAYDRYCKRRDVESVREMYFVPKHEIPGTLQLLRRSILPKTL